MAVLLALLASAVGCDALLTDPAAQGRIRIVALDRHGTPLPGIRAELFLGYRRMGYLTTDGSGVADYREVPEGNYGVYMVLPPEYAGWDEIRGGSRDDFRAGIVVRPGLDTTLHFEFLRRGIGSVVVWAIDQDSLAVPDREVTLYSPRGVLGFDTTDASGRAEFPSVAFGNYGVRSTAPDTFRAPGAALAVVRDGLVIDQGRRETVVLSMPRCRGSVDVRVVDEVGGPVADTPVILYRGPRVFRQGTTDATGWLTWTRVTCGEYGAALTPPPTYFSPWARDTAFVDGLTLADGQSIRVTLRALQCAGRIAVRVEEASGIGVAGATVSRYTGAGVGPQLTTDPSGAATFLKVPCGVHGVFVTPPEGYAGTWARDSQFVDDLTIRVGTVKSVTLRLTKRP